MTVYSKNIKLLKEDYHLFDFPSKLNCINMKEECNLKWMDENAFEIEE